MTTAEGFMRAALAEAAQAAAQGEVPVGAVVVHAGEVVGRGRNGPIGACDPTAHAEIRALREAARRLGNYRLPDCELYVTLEPCAMCAGAILHARLKKVIFGAQDAKTGAAGGVVDLFANGALNHQTAVAGGVLADECGALLKTFFAGRRRELREENTMPDVLRTPDARFADLPGYPFAPNYLGDLKGYQGLRIHYLDEGPRAAARTFLCLHGEPTWSYLYRRMIPVFAGAGHRVVAPDLLGFGKSDKPADDARYTFLFHRQMLVNFIERLDLTGVVLVVQDWGGLLGLTLPMDMPQRFTGLLVMNTAFGTGDAPLSPGFIEWRAFNRRNPDLAIGRMLGRACPHLSPAEAAAYDAPYPDASYKGGVRRFPDLVPDRPDAEGAALSRRARDWFAREWAGRTFMAVGMKDPVLGPPVMREVARSIRNCPPPFEVAEGGHFVQEWGEDIARAALQAL
ncbi:MAG: tRNA adenosine(34) deaminase TadA [Burkholderiales bacterium]|nr:tRNA adenosine(34) deaminase TadA [Burkholderiales bacterium]